MEASLRKCYALKVCMCVCKQRAPRHMGHLDIQHVHRPHLTGEEEPGDSVAAVGCHTTVHPQGGRAKLTEVHALSPALGPGLTGAFFFLLLLPPAEC